MRIYKIAVMSGVCRICRKEILPMSTLCDTCWEIIGSIRHHIEQKSIACQKHPRLVEMIKKEYPELFDE